MSTPKYIIVEMKYETINNKLLMHYLKDTDFEYEFLTEKEKEIVENGEVLKALKERLV